jgi:hypothetical protein
LHEITEKAHDDTSERGGAAIKDISEGAVNGLKDFSPDHNDLIPNEKFRMMEQLYEVRSLWDMTGAVIVDPQRYLESRMRRPPSNVTAIL